MKDDVLIERFLDELIEKQGYPQSIVTFIQQGLGHKDETNSFVRIEAIIKEGNLALSEYNHHYSPNQTTYRIKEAGGYIKWLEGQMGLSALWYVSEDIKRGHDKRGETEL